ncbi:MAG: TonB-dependent receptor [Acidocella sp.]|nr:TonB-dependent receptor [Acidocella sp.]
MKSGLAACAAWLLPGLALADTTSPTPPAKRAPEQVVVTAHRLDLARSRLQPGLGATVHALDAKALAQIPQGENAALNTVLLQVPGVAEDSFGQIHVRGDHNDVQYRINGVELPEGLAVFGQVLESRFARSLDLIDGALPAQYGFLQAAVVDITARSGTTNPGGEISVYGGARDYMDTAIDYGKRVGAWDFYVTGDFLHTRVGIENPTPAFNAQHDLSNQYHALANLSYIASPDTRLSLIAGISDAQFQIPNNPGQVPALGYQYGGISSVPSSSLTEHQREITDFGIISLQQQYGALNIQNSLFSRYSSLYFSPSLPGDVLFTGIGQTAARSVWSNGEQSDATLDIGANHTLRFGTSFTVERGISTTSSQVFALSQAGQQLGSLPETINQGFARTGTLYGIYAQDEWRILHGLTLNYGARFDAVNEYTHGEQLSPRVNLVWKANRRTTLHAGYSRYFTPPPFEDISGSAVTAFNHTSAAATVTQDATVKSERDNYYDAGIDYFIMPHWHVELDGYFKQARNLIDEGQFGAPIILSAFNYKFGQVGGVELATDYTSGPWSLYANTAYSRAIGKDIITSQFNFQPAELAYISQHWIYLDHDERWAGSGGAAYTVLPGAPDQARLSADLVVGSGLRASGSVPNGLELPGYYVINLSYVQKLGVAWPGLSARLDALNLLDRAYVIRNGTGVGVGAPQYGLRRSLLVGLTQHF